MASVCSCCCYACERACMKRLNAVCPGLCPVRERPARRGRPGNMERFVQTCSYFAHKRKNGNTISSPMAFVLTEHSLFSLFFIPEPTRPTDLHWIQYVLVYGLGVVVGLFLALRVAEMGAVWLSGWHAVLAKILFIHMGAAFAKACYKSALKRTYHCRLKVWDLKVAETPALKKAVSTAREFNMMVSFGQSSKSTDFASTFDQLTIAEEEALSLPLNGEDLTVTVQQRGSTGNCLCGASSTDNPVALATGTLWIDVLTEQLNERLSSQAQLGISNRAASTPLGSVTLAMRAVRDEPITPLAMLMAFLKPITDCVILRFMVFSCCWPCCFVWCIQQRQNKARRAKEKKLKEKRERQQHRGKSGGCFPSVDRGLDVSGGRGAAQKPLLENGQEPKSERSSAGFQGDTWRHKVLRPLLFVCLFVVALHYMYYWMSSGEDSRDRIRKTLKLYLTAKVSTVFILEPGGLLWTYFSLYCLKPSSLPQYTPEDLA
eukprot:TRINITY_DN69818_c0_g1_i1.p1 TRINITY_DN69818_c0_g1~~TRINITY_DN69818_c0_g1_i1.p1  ORF type:complete len:488 (-),score=73.42 TRINITY_DN69818_c0_g1_i1:34-1497(-)